MGQKKMSGTRYALMSAAHAQVTPADPVFYTGTCQQKSENGEIIWVLWAPLVSCIAVLLGFLHVLQVMGKKSWDRNFISWNFCVLLQNVYLRHLMKMRCYCSCLSKAAEAPKLVLLSVAGHGSAPSLMASSEGHLGMYKQVWWQRPWFRKGASPRFTATMASSVSAIINCGKTYLK